MGRRSQLQGQAVTIWMKRPGEPPIGSHSVKIHQLVEIYQQTRRVRDVTIRHCLKEDQAFLIEAGASISAWSEFSLQGFFDLPSRL